MTAASDRGSLFSSALRILLVAGLLGGWQASLNETRAQAKPDQAALLLDSARKASTEKNYPVAAMRFREYLQRFASNKDVNQARYGLVLALLEGPTRDYQAALEQLNRLLTAKDLPERPYVVWYAGLCYRALGTGSLAQAEAKPAEAAQHRANAKARFEEAGKQFAAAAVAFAAAVKDPDPNAREIPIELEWAARARCDQAEMLLRTGKTGAAQDVTAAFLKDKLLARSRYRGLGIYQHGFASFLLKDYFTAGRSLSQLTPFTDPIWGSHARYLLARIHQADGERQEAMQEYEAALNEYNRQKARGIEELKQPERFKNDPEEKARLERLVRGAPPDHVARSLFFLGVLQYEDGRFAEALTRFATFAQQMPNSPLTNDARLRQGFCQVQLKQFNEAVRTLEPLVNKDTKLADQAQLWIGKAQVGAGFLPFALQSLKQAASRASQLVPQDPDAKVRYAEILAEMADTQQLAKNYLEAAALYREVLAKKSLPRREEELTLSLATACQLAGDFSKSDEVCGQFRARFPKSVLLPAVLFRHAENAWFSLLQAEKLPDAQQRAREVSRWNDEALERYQVVVEKFPEFPQVNLARYGVALAYYRKGDLEKAKEKLEAIPAPERTGELGLVSYQLADCLIRLTPTKVDDAIAAGQAEEMLKTTIEQLTAFVGSNPNGPQAPDALLKLGHCYQRQAGLLAQPPERQKALASARAAYDQVRQRFGNRPEAAQAIFERARVIGLQGDPNGAMNELRRFSSNPLKNSPVAPLAVLRLATLLRSQNKAAEAAVELARCRQDHEAALSRDPARAGLVSLLLYHHGVALREAGKRTEARALFEQLLKQAPDRPESAEAALRSGQCLKEEAAVKLTEAENRLAQPNLKPEIQQAAVRARESATKEMKDAISYLQAQADRLKQKQPESETRARMLYEAAWGFRTLADLETAQARKKLQQELWQKRRDDLARKLGPGKPLSNVPQPEVPLSAIPLQPSETAARTHYQALLQAFPDLPIRADVCLELAELFAERGEHDSAIKLLREALDKEPGPEVTDKVRVRLGDCLLSKGDTKGALVQFNAVVANPKSSQLAEALYRSAECFLLAGDNGEAVKRLTRFRDEGPLRHVPGVSDRALLRMGHALERLKQWEASRQALETLLNRFPGSPWAAEGRYGMGWAQQNLKQYDNAVASYTLVTRMTAGELAARAQLNLGLCRLAQKRYQEATTALLVVPHNYDYPRLSAISLLEAARAHSENKQRDQAIQLLERVVRDHPNTEQADAARKRLVELKKGA